MNLRALSECVEFSVSPRAFSEFVALGQFVSPSEPVGHRLVCRPSMSLLVLSEQVGLQ